MGGGGGSGRGLKSERELQAVLARLGNDIMRGLQRLAGGSFYSGCQDQCTTAGSDGASVHVLFFFWLRAVKADEGVFLVNERSKG